MNQCQFFCKFHCTHVKYNKKTYVTKKQHVFHAPGHDNHSNQEVDIDVISNVMKFLTSRIKVQTVHTEFKKIIFS